VRYEIRYRLNLAAGAARLLGAFSVSAEHDEGAALRDHLSGDRHLSAVRKEVLAALPLAFVFALTYDMFVLLILAAAIWTVVVGWAENV